VPSLPRGPEYAILSGVAAGAIVVVLILATSPALFAGYQWPPAGQVEGWSVRFAQPGIYQDGSGQLASDCTTMLAELDSNAPVTLWVIPYIEMVNSSIPPTISSYYYWSGGTPVSHISTVVTITDPAAGINMVVYDSSELSNIIVHFGFWFSASDCPEPA
jgi:hypothetical protein